MTGFESGDTSLARGDSTQQDAGHSGQAEEGSNVSKPSRGKVRASMKSLCSLLNFAEYEV